MDVVKYLFVAVHLLSMAAIVGGWFARFRTPSVTAVQLIGACGAVLSGLILVGLAEMGDGSLNHAKIGVKLVLALAVLGAAIVGTLKARKDQPVSTGLAHAVGGTALINVLIATLWH
ncbi:MAG TPA: hypothetical protein IAA98_06065 [Candidatus Avipropionibacterium avicola]|uniref:Uncharacterized protein n=1 Tax=Candidatus Avipropionibacterium avicola TaxID=2840701 RepID=A0A9D1GX04_9ACTN|nr:hypothetical protein [Candidatus Avipropionibacterium avicola]